MSQSRLNPFVSLLTAISLVVALTASVFAQSHVSSELPSSVDEPCAQHDAPVVEDHWAETCASLCTAADFHVVVSLSSERSLGPDLVASPVVHEATVPVAILSAPVAWRFHAHDPPRSNLYLTTQRLRI